MNYLGADPTATDFASTSASSISGVSSAIASIYSTYSYWEGILDSAANEYDKAIAEQKLAERDRKIAEVKAAEAFKRYGVYAGAALGGVVLLAVVAYAATRKGKRK